MLSLSIFLPLSIWAGVVWLAYTYNVYLNRKSHAKSQGCEEPTTLQQESFLGYGMLRDSFEALRNSTYLRLGKQRFDENGDTFAFKQMGKLGVLTNDPINVKAILSTQFQDFGVGKRRAEAFEPLIGHGIFTADGASWEKARKLVKPSFSRGQLDDISTFEPHLQNFLASLPGEDEAIDLQPLFQGLTLDVSTDFLFGESTNVLGSAKAASAGRSFANAFDNAQKSVVNAFALGSVGWLDPRSNFKQDQKTVEAFMSGYVDKALDKEEDHTQRKQDSKYSFASEFAKLTDDRAMIRGGLLNLLLAGRDTTASLLSNLFFMLARRPDVYNKLAAEIQSTVPTPGEAPSLEALKSMKYLRACINESLRLHPPIPRNSREALRDTTLPVGGGVDGTAPILVPKGTQVGYQVFSMHRRKDVYGEDADEFVPERWTERNLRPGWYVTEGNTPTRCLRSYTDSKPSLGRSYPSMEAQGFALDSSLRLIWLLMLCVGWCSGLKGWRAAIRGLGRRAWASLVRPRMGPGFDCISVKRATLSIGNLNECM
jgi:cytochrome P450